MVEVDCSCGEGKTDRKSCRGRNLRCDTHGDVMFNSVSIYIYSFNSVTAKYIIEKFLEGE